MAITRVSKVPLIPQKYDGTCWYASLRMLAEWRKASKGSLGTMIDPTAHTDIQSMADNNRGWPPKMVAKLAGWVKAKTRSDIKMEFDSLNKVLTTSGPIWAGGLKEWGTAAHNHVVVIFGVADTGVLIHDPEPVNTGRESWKEWSQMRKYIDGGECDVPYIVCP